MMNIAVEEVPESFGFVQGRSLVRAKDKIKGF
jgi:hypothetical protein